MCQFDWDDSQNGQRMSRKNCSHNCNRKHDATENSQPVIENKHALIVRPLKRSMKPQRNPCKITVLRVSTICNEKPLYTQTTNIIENYSNSLESPPPAIGGKVDINLSNYYATTKSKCITDATTLKNHEAKVVKIVETLRYFLI